MFAQDIVLDTWQIVTGILTHPNQRLHVGYLLSSALIALYLLHHNQDLSRGKTLLSKKLWWSASARLDYKLIVFNSFFKALLLGQFTVLGITISNAVGQLLRETFGPSPTVLSAATAIMGFTVSMTLLNDLCVYLLHRMMHSVPLLWSFHRIHHSATTMTPLTLLRLHPIELLLNNFRSALIFGLLAGGFGHLADHKVSEMTFLGANLFSFAFFAFGANLRHSHIRFGYWQPLERLLISPLQHQIHHSISAAHHNRNFGSKLAIWDFFFGTLMTSKNVSMLQFGLPKDNEHRQTLCAALLSPFKDEIDEVPLISLSDTNRSFALTASISMSNDADCE